MAFIREADFDVELPDPGLKVQLLNILGEFMRDNGIQTRRVYARGLYTVDVIEALGNELELVPDEKVKESLKTLISKVSILVGAST